MGVNKNDSKWILIYNFGEPKLHVPLRVTASQD